MPGFGSGQVKGGGGGHFTDLPKPGQKIVVRCVYDPNDTDPIKEQHGCWAPHPEKANKTVWCPWPGDEAARQILDAEGKSLAGYQTKPRYRCMVINKTTQALEVMEGTGYLFTQIDNFAANERWGQPIGYDLEIAGETSNGFQVQKVTPIPHAPLTDAENAILQAQWAEVIPDLEFKTPSLAEVVQMIGGSVVGGAPGGPPAQASGPAAPGAGFPGAASHGAQGVATPPGGGFLPPGAPPQAPGR